MTRATDDSSSDDARHAGTSSGPSLPAEGVPVVACTDALPDIHRILGLREGEAHVIRNSGGVVTDDEIRSLAVSQRLLGTREIVLVHHTDDGSGHSVEGDTGIRPTWAAEAFPEAVDDVRQSIARIRANPFVPEKGSVRGFVFDVATGKLDEVV